MGPPRRHTQKYFFILIKTEIKMFTQISVFLILFLMLSSETTTVLTPLGCLPTLSLAITRTV